MAERTRLFCPLRCNFCNQFTQITFFEAVRIGELAKMAEVTPDTIRYYEKQQMITPGIWAKAVGINGDRAAVIDWNQTMLCYRKERLSKISRPCLPTPLSSLLRTVKLPLSMAIYSCYLDISRGFLHSISSDQYYS